MDSLDLHTGFGKTMVALVVAIAASLVYSSVIRDPDKMTSKPQSDQPCGGTPIVVDYPFHGGMIEPHACAEQCEDRAQHYILYSNGKATQCQILPGCLDWGEDQGVTCVPSK